MSDEKTASSGISLKWAAIIAAVILLFAGVGGVFAGMSWGRSAAIAEKDAEFEGVLRNLATEHKQIEVTKNDQVRSLQELVAKQGEDIGTQAALITSLRGRPAQVKFVTRVETVLVPGEDRLVEVPVEKLPEEHLFALELPDGKLVVARVLQVDEDNDGVNDTVQFETFEQRWTLQAALGEESSSFLLQAKSSYDDQVVEVPVDVQVTHIDPDPPKKLSAHLAMGGTVFAGASGGVTSPRVGAGFSLTLPWLHPRPDVDVLTPRVTIGAVYPILEEGSIAKFSFRGGLDIVSYNVGRPGKFIQDLWFGVGPSFGTDNSWSVDLSVTTRL